MSRSGLLSKELERQLRAIFNKREQERLEGLIAHRRNFIEKAIRRRNKNARKNRKKRAYFYNDLAREAHKQLAEYSYQLSKHHYLVQLRLECYSEKYTVFKTIKVSVTQGNYIITERELHGTK